MLGGVCRVEVLKRERHGQEVVWHAVDPTRSGHDAREGRMSAMVVFEAEDPSMVVVVVVVIETMSGSEGRPGVFGVAARRGGGRRRGRYELDVGACR